MTTHHLSEDTLPYTAEDVEMAREVEEGKIQHIVEVKMASANARDLADAVSMGYIALDYIAATLNSTQINAEQLICSHIRQGLENMFRAEADGGLYDNFGNT